jgi:outer membrane protein assembly factor BamD
MAVILFIFFTGCGGKKIFVAKSAEEAYEYAMERYQKEDYQEAASGFQRVVFNFPGDKLVEEAMYYLADSYFRDEDYLLAANEFKRVSSEFPDRQYAVISLYKWGLCHMRLSLSYRHDQKDTRRAIESFNTLIDRFPGNAYVDSARVRVSELHDKLARKDYESGYYYFKRKYYDSAIIYFEVLREDYPESKWTAPALYYLSKAYEKLDLHDDADETRRDLIERFPDSEESRKVVEEHPDLMDNDSVSTQ